MTNKEYLESLSAEELVSSDYFMECPYGQLYIQTMEVKGEEICAKKKAIRGMGIADIANFVFSGQQKDICTKCKLNWLSQERIEPQPVDKDTVIGKLKEVYRK